MLDQIPCQFPARVQKFPAAWRKIPCSVRRRPRRVERSQWVIVLLPDAIAIFSLLAGNSLRADLLALEGDVGDDENHDRRRDEPRELRPNQDEALRGRQRRSQERALQLADQ